MRPWRFLWNGGQHDAEHNIRRLTKWAVSHLGFWERICIWIVIIIERVIHDSTFTPIPYTIPSGTRCLDYSGSCSGSSVVSKLS